MGLVTNRRGYASSMRFNRVTNCFTQVYSSKLCVAWFTIQYCNVRRDLPAFYSGERRNIFVRRSLIRSVYRNVSGGTDNANFKQEMEDHIRRTNVPMPVQALWLYCAYTRDGGWFYVGIAVLIFFERYLRCFNGASRCPAIAASPRGLLSIDFFFSRMTTIAMGWIFLFVRGMIMDDLMFFVRRLCMFFLSHRNVRFNVCKEYRRGNVTPYPTIRYLWLSMVRFRNYFNEVFCRPINTNRCQRSRFLLFMLLMWISGKLPRHGRVNIMRPFSCLRVVLPPCLRWPFMMNVIAIFLFDCFYPICRTRMRNYIHPIRIIILDSIIKVNCLPVDCSFRRFFNNYLYRECLYQYCDSSRVNGGSRGAFFRRVSLVGSSALAIKLSFNVTARFLFERWG